METTEAKVAQTILQQPVEISIGAKTYSVAPPSVATLILASEVISRMPQENFDDNNIMEESLSIAKDCRELGELAAILILGAKHIDELEEHREKRKKRHLWGLFHTTHTKIIVETAKERLSRELLEDLTPRELHSVIAQALLKMQVGDFFGLTTFLIKINLLRPKKVVI